MLDNTVDLLVPAEVMGVKTPVLASQIKACDTNYLWYPYLPVGDYTVMMAAGGTGKTILCCGIAAAVSTGKGLPGMDLDGEGRDVLIISAEDSGPILRSRLKQSGANLDRVHILDRVMSYGMDFSSHAKDFSATIRSVAPALVIIDPWHAFLGPAIDMNRPNVIRPILQLLAKMAKECQCAMIVVSHLNKGRQGENINNAALGSTDFINAARSAIRVIFDEEDKNSRIMVHTKSNYGPAGESIRYHIIQDGGMEWEGYSPISRWDLEEAARQRTTPGKLMSKVDMQSNLINALKASIIKDGPNRYSYEEFISICGNSIFEGMQPKRALDSVIPALSKEGIFLKTGIHVKRGNTTQNGFMIQKMEPEEPQD